ncbi:hypothetical protein [Frigoribacterium salinisoli]
MSTATALAPATAGPDHGSTRPVEVVTSRDQRRARPKVAYALVATAALFVLLLTQLGISIALSDGAYQISALQSEQTELARDQQKYAEQLDVLSSPQNLANNADALGMVRNSNPVYLDLATGAVHGVPAPAEAGPDGTGDNLIGNTLLQGVPVVGAADAATGGTAPAASDPASTTSPGTTAPAADASVPGAAVGPDAPGSVPSGTDQLAAPETR